MALFPGDIGTYTTPDGRAVKLPSGLAINFPGLQPLAPPEVAQPPVLPSTPPAPIVTPEEIADRTPPDTVPVTRPAQVPSGAPQQSPAQAPSRAPDQQDAGPPNPVTNAQLAKEGNAGVLAQQNAALEQRGTAQRGVTAVDAAEANRVGQEMVRRNDEQQQILEERAATAQQFQQDLDSKMAEYERNAKAISDTKVDRSVDHPILAALGVLLGGLGAAMQGKGENPAMAALYQAIDRKVASQMQDLDNRRAALGVQREAIGMQRQAGMDRLALMDQRRIAALDQATRTIETVKQQSQSDRVKANGEVLQAQLQQDKATILEQAAARESAKLQHEQDRKSQERMHAQSIGVQLRGQNLEQKRFEAGLEEKARERDMLAQEKADALKAKYGERAEKAAKDKRERGVFDPNTSEYMVTADGKKKLEDADRLEAAARAADPATAAKQREQAQKLRESVALNDAALATDEVAARRLRPIVSSSNSMYADLVDLKERLDKDPSAFERDQWARIATSAMDAQAKYMAAIGERVSPRAFEAIKGHAIALNPDDLGSRTFSKEKAIASIDQLMSVVKTTVDSELRSEGISSAWVPGSPNREQKFEGSTSQEIGADATPGLLGKAAIGVKEAGKALLYPIDATSPDSTIGRRNPALEAENAAVGNATSYGLDPKTAETTRSLIQQANTTGDAKRAQIVDSLVQPLLRDDRPGLAGGIVSVLRESDPKLLTEVLSRVYLQDKQRALDLARFEQMRATLPGAPPEPPPVNTERPIGLPWKAAP